MAYYGVSLDVAVQKLNFEFRIALKKKGANGIRSLAKIFKEFDINGNKKLDPKEFEAALAQVGLFPTKVQLQGLIEYYDTDKDGNITYEEFLKGLREPMNERRKALLDKVFTSLDKNGSGDITIADIEKCFHAEKHRDFIEKKKTKEEILNEFLNALQGPKGNKDGKITKEEFYDYYSDISMTIPQDDYFAAMIENAWMITEKDGTETAKDRTENLIKKIVAKLKEIANPIDDKILPKIFKEFNKSKSGGITIDEAYAMFMNLEISTERKFMTDFIRYFDKNQSGTIEYDEFVTGLKQFL